MFSARFDENGDYTLVYRDATVCASWSPENSDVTEFDIDAPCASFSYNTGNGVCELTWDIESAMVTMTVAKAGDGQGGYLETRLTAPGIVESLRAAVRTIVKYNSARLD